MIKNKGVSRVKKTSTEAEKEAEVIEAMKEAEEKAEAAEAKEAAKENDTKPAVSIRPNPHQERIWNVSKDWRLNVFNVVEAIAKENVAGVMDRMGVCTCSKCAGDVLALALNTLPTKYVTSDAGKQYFLLSSYKKQFETDVDVALMKACLLVKESPSHDKAEKA